MGVLLCMCDKEGVFSICLLNSEQHILVLYLVLYFLLRAFLCVTHGYTKYMKECADQPAKPRGATAPREPAHLSHFPGLKCFFKTLLSLLSVI